ncbi:MAG: hypothetical protein EOO01_00385, partial [Chitinophagaceae bacterium]
MRHLFFILVFLSSFLFSDAQIYVSVNGSDMAEGTKEKPLATVHMALRKAREMRRLNQSAFNNGIQIFVDKGVYHFSEPLVIRPEDAGTENSPTVIQALSEQPVFSGGITISGWKKLTSTSRNLPPVSRGKVWVADVPNISGDLLNFRQLWVNNKKAIRARDRSEDNLNRILSWNHQTEKCWIPKPAADISKAQRLE